ncbi:periplasmic thioredoxin of cytochrome c-type biogenesis [Sterolibacterium denitrificans]|uniref:Thiol:disulfide interchange protein n=2 Tax=Sterolibacterium denitrificans TaxID=157592 RepID=A0A656Z744_9PROT|nr:DsbE family thiol:disulfide interchange protein [Sterolibacterium denitrificans]KYC28914.1 thiol:disulfide interchange protein [Sterolibacterium denitrificans]SMB23395.1 periplasmic thioredoxin of cytochrome c-type biogenesis [Sterolibacterium denitrificans]
MKRFLIPVVLFVLLLGLLAVGLNLNPREVPSPLVGKPAPAFQLARLDDASRTFSPADMRGQVWLLNVWASWCVSCRAEHPLLVSFARQGLVPVVGLNYKEVRGDGELDAGRLGVDEEKQLVRSRAQAWLDQRGDPYRLTALDIDGRVGIDYGVYGVPETYVIDKAGVIRYKQIGPLTPEALERKILPLVKELEALKS